MSGSTFAVQLPQPNAPFFNPNGGLSVIWLNWFLAIQNRTGGAHGIPASGLQDQINALFVEQAFSDEPDLVKLLPYAMASVMDDTAGVPGPALLLLALTDGDVPKASANPFLAALLVGDVT